MEELRMEISRDVCHNFDLNFYSETGKLITSISVDRNTGAVLVMKAKRSTVHINENQKTEKWKGSSGYEYVTVDSKI